MRALTWIRKNIFRIYRGGKHRTDGFSTLEKLAFSVDLSDIQSPDPSPYAPAEREALRNALKPSTALLLPTVPYVPGPDGAWKSVDAPETVVQQRVDYQPKYMIDTETLITPKDWTTEQSVW